MKERMNCTSSMNGIRLTDLSVLLLLHVLLSNVICEKVSRTYIDANVQD